MEKVRYERPVYLDMIGLPATLEQTAEECCELAHAALKYSRVLRAENPTPVTEEEAAENFLEELADVCNMIQEFVPLIFEESAVQTRIEAKIRRSLNRFAGMEC